MPARSKKDRSGLEGLRGLHDRATSGRTEGAEGRDHLASDDTALADPRNQDLAVSRHRLDQGDNVPERLVRPALLYVRFDTDGALGVRCVVRIFATVVARVGAGTAARIGRADNVRAVVIEKWVRGRCQSGCEGEESVRLVADDV